VKINKAIVVVLACLFLGWGLGADDKGMSIGIVDLDQAVLSTDEGKHARSELERRAREAEIELKPMIEELQALMTEYQQKEESCVGGLPRGATAKHRRRPGDREQADQHRQQLESAVERLDAERADHWTSKGAQLSPRVEKLLKDHRAQ